MTLLYVVFGWIRKKPKKKPDTGLMYAGHTTTDTKTPQKKNHTIQTQDGSLELYDTHLRLNTTRGMITVPYNTIDAWDADAKSFRVWYTEGRRNYTFSCKPEQSPEEDLAKFIHNAMYE